jgi:hypothetical protein
MAAILFEGRPGFSLGSSWSAVPILYSPGDTELLPPLQDYRPVAYLHYRRRIVSDPRRVDAIQEHLDFRWPTKPTPDRA